MKTLVAYASKYGTTEKCAKEVGSKLKGEVDYLNLKQSNYANLDDYDKIIVGGSINAGKIQPETRKFVNKYFVQLSSCKLGLFICCGAEGDEAQKELDENYPKALLDHAIAKDYFGGEIKLSAMPVFIRFIVKKMAKTDIDKDTLLPDHINRFIVDMNKA
jgi:menaquinone-dependent protoporphyrinogen oxidase